jgi:SAM-dependent methyltransferase
MQKIIEGLPFHIGYLETYSNPDGIPDILDFRYSIDLESGVVKQDVSKLTLDALGAVYELGLEIGTPLSSDELGAPYLEDFADFVIGQTFLNSQILEIGVGRGHLSYLLSKSDRKVIGIEPGRGYSREWGELGIQVVRDFFPSNKIKGNFDGIVSYAVLEHVDNPALFLQAMAAQLTVEGKIFLSVPDCTEEIRDGDASMFIHEHLSYFSVDSLMRLISMAGLEGKVEKSRYGRNLYATIESPSEKSQRQKTKSGSWDFSNAARAFLDQTEKNTSSKRKLISQFLESGTLGIYAPVRAIPFLTPTKLGYRFFDDDPRIQGRYIVPFPSRVESRLELFAQPVDVLVIASRTFGKRVESELRADGYEGKIVLLWNGLSGEPVPGA